MSREQTMETSLVPGGEMVVSFQQTKPGSEQVRFAGPVSLLGVSGVAVLFVPGSVLPANHRAAWKPVQDVTGSGKIQLYGGAVGMGTVGDHRAHTVTPSGSLFNEKPAQRCFRPFWEHGQHLPGVAIDDHGHIPVAFL